MNSRRISNLLAIVTGAVLCGGIGALAQHAGGGAETRTCDAPATLPQIAQSAGASIDAGGIAEFWSIVDRFKSSQPVTQAHWQRLFDSPGYRQFEAEERQRARREGLVMTAFAPSLSQWADACLRMNDADARAIAHLRFADRHRDFINAFVERFATRESLEKSIELARMYLPRPVRAVEPPPVCLFVLYPGGRATPEAVVVDAAMLAHTTRPETVIAHELHHVFRRPLDRVNHDAVAADDTELVAALTGFELDGVAALINMRPILLRASGLPEAELVHPRLKLFWEQCAAVYEECPKWIATIDEKLRERAAHPERAKSIGEDLERALPSVAKYVVGMHMADVIEHTLGRELLIETVGDPFAFFRAYGEAAQASSGRIPTWSEPTLELLTIWECAYAKVPSTPESSK